MDNQIKASILFCIAYTSIVMAMLFQENLKPNVLISNAFFAMALFMLFAYAWFNYKAYNEIKEQKILEIDSKLKENKI